MGAVKTHKPPTVDINTSWDAAIAKKQLREWATTKNGDIDFKKYMQGFAWFDDSNSETLGAYKLPHHYVENGKLVSVWKGIAAAGAAIMGARGGVDIPDSDLDAVKKHLEVHYKQFNKVPPWKAAESSRKMEIPISLKLSSKTGKKVEAILIRAGITANGEYFSEEVLQNSVNLFKEVPIGAYKVDDRFFHNPYESVDAVLNIVGFTTKNVRYENGAIVGEIIFHNEEIQKIITAYDSLGKALGLSIVAFVDGGWEGEQFIVKEIKSVVQVDIVSYPAAGGKITKILEGGDTKMMKEILKKLEEMKIELNEEMKKEIEKMTEGLEDFKEAWEKVKKLLKVNEEKNEDEKTDEKTGEKTDGKDKKEDEKEKDDGQIEKDKSNQSEEGNRIKEEIINELQEMKEMNKKLSLKFMVESKKISEEMKSKLYDLIDRNKIEKPEEIDEFLSMMNMKAIQEGVSMKNVNVGKSYDKMKEMEMGLLKALGHDAPKNEEEKKVFESAPFITVREFVEEILDKNSLSAFRAGDFSRGLKIKESIASTDLPNILGNILNKRLIQEFTSYLGDDILQIVKTRPIKDFKAQTAVRYGGLSGILSTIDEGNAYPDAGTVTDEKISYEPKKYGAILKITRETMLKDDLGALSGVVRRLARKAKRTLIQFICDLLINYDPTNGINGGTIYDGNPLYDDANHGNLVADALAYSSLKNAWTKMRKQTEYGSGEPLGLTPKFLIVPPELEFEARDLIEQEYIPGNNADINTRNVFKGKMQVIVSDFLRGDGNNWYVVANPRDIETIELGFLNGRKAPELITNDAATAYSMFYEDAIAFKVRYEFGGAVVDYRSFVGGIVA